MYKDPDDGRQRFLLELEFVQCLANPTYIHCMFFLANHCSFTLLRALMCSFIIFHCKIMNYNASLQNSHLYEEKNKEEMKMLKIA